MYSTQKKEQFNIAYVAAIAAQAGITQITPTVDDDSIDLILYGKGYKGTIRNPQVQVQLKCTSQDMIQGGFIKFPLSIKNYEDLRGENVLCPRYLVVLLVPENHDEWILHAENCMMLHNRCFWLCLKSLPSTSNLTTVTVDIPLSQRFTTETLLTFMNNASHV